MPEETYTPAEAAEIIGVSERWLRDKQRAGLVPFHRYTRRVKFTASDVAEIQRLYAKPARKKVRV